MPRVRGSIPVLASAEASAIRDVSVGRASRLGHRRASRMAGLSIVVALVIAAVAAPWVSGSASAIAGEALRAPGRQHLFGTDDLGRDLLAGVLHGARTSLYVGTVAALLSTLVAVAVGGIAA